MTTEELARLRFIHTRLGAVLDEIKTYKSDLIPATPNTNYVLGLGVGTLLRGMDFLARDIIHAASQTSTKPTPDQPARSPG
jgi:hypothetical protein